MKKFKKLLALSSLLLILPGCAGADEDEKEYKGETLVIYNVEDYISSGDDDSVDLIAKFEEETGCEVKYYTYDTNETMYNQYKLQKEGTYDLVLASDYMIQKMAKEGLIDPIDHSKLPIYNQNVAKCLREKLENMKVVVDEQDHTLDEYAVGYMWGTLGIIYNAECSDTVEEDVLHWDAFYNPKYKDKVSIKNSMRDTYDVGLIHSYYNSEYKDPEYERLLNDYLNNYNEETAAAFNAYIQKVFDFNLEDSQEAYDENQAKIDAVKKELIKLKENIFGLETDSGKNDIVEGSKIVMNLAYSGDAVYSIDQGNENGKTLQYSVPLEGSNIWYDAWMLPKGSSHRGLAYKFLDFMSDSENAASNADYIGYTPFVVGEDMFTYMASCYGASYYDENIEYDEETYVIKDGELFVSELDDNEEIIWSSLEYDSLEEYEDGDMVSKEGTIYNIEIVSEIPVLSEVEPFSLAHIFGDSVENREAVIFPFAGCENQLETQYPTEEIINRCAIMNDYGDYNENVIIMWGQIKAYTNMTFTYVFLIIFICAVLGLAIYFVASKKASIRFRRNAKKAR